jgi:RNA-splicing ligase RtcB
MGPAQDSKGQTALSVVDDRSATLTSGTGPLTTSDVARVARVVERAGLAAPVVQLRPLGVVKG